MSICNCTKKTLTLIGGIVAACAAVAGVVVLTLKFISKHKKNCEKYTETVEDDDEIITFDVTVEGSKFPAELTENDEKNETSEDATTVEAVETAEKPEE